MKLLAPGVKTLPNSPDVSALELRIGEEMEIKQMLFIRSDW